MYCIIVLLLLHAFVNCERNINIGAGVERAIAISIYLAYLKLARDIDAHAFYYTELVLRCIAAFLIAYVFLFEHV